MQPAASLLPQFGAIVLPEVVTTGSSSYKRLYAGERASA
jgi:hypothetical protein